MKKSVFLPILLPLFAFSLFLSGCESATETIPMPEVESTAETVPVPPVIEIVTETTEAEPEETEAPAGEPEVNEEGQVRSYLTNLWIDPELREKRPVAVMYPIDQKAQPQYGLNRVCVFYEMLEEGSMSRQMGIIEDWEDLNRIGNIRSIRDYFVHVALEWDPVIIHFGGPEVFVKDILTRKDVDNLNGVSGKMGPDYGAFYRVPKGSKSTHSAYTDGEHILKGIEKAGFSRNHREDYYRPHHYDFAPASDPNTLEQYENAVSAEDIKMAGSFPVTKSSLTYNPEDGKYYKKLYGNAQKDAVTGEQLAFDNILIQKASHSLRPGGLYLSIATNDGPKEGYFITRGKMIPITWVKTDDYEPTVYYDENGANIRLNTGKTMVFIIKDSGNSFTCDGETYN